MQAASAACLRASAVRPVSRASGPGRSGRSRSPGSARRVPRTPRPPARSAPSGSRPGRAPRGSSPCPARASGRSSGTEAAMKSPRSSSSLPSEQLVCTLASHDSPSTVVGEAASLLKRSTRRRGRPPRPAPSGRAAPPSPAVVTIVTSFSALSKPMSGREMSLTTTASRPLQELRAPRSTPPAPCSAAKPTNGLARATIRGDGGQDVGGGLELDHEPIAARLRDLVGRRLGRAEVRRRGGHREHVGACELRPDSRLELGARAHVDRADARGPRQRHVRAHERDLGAAAGRLLGEREAHPPGRAVAHSGRSRSARACRPP